MLRGRPGGLFQLAFLPSDAVHHVLVLHGPGVQHGPIEISVDDVRCHQWLTNQIAEAPLHWRHEPTSIHQVSVADTSCGKPPMYSCRRPRGSMSDLISVWYRCTLMLILRELQFHALCRKFITEQASPILHRTSSGSSH